MPKQAYSTDHQWVGAIELAIPANLAGVADRRGTVRVPEQTKVDVLEVYCGQCRRPYDAVAGQPCIASTGKGREHLVGGPTGERAKRKHPDHDCERYGCDIDTSRTGQVKDRDRRTG